MGCVGKYPSEKLNARAWLMQDAPSSSSSTAATKTVSQTAPEAIKEFVASPMPPKDFPENDIEALKTKADLGLAFSGGGNRAAVCALGQVRALTEIGVMKNVRYVSSVSGGSWFCVPYTFHHEDEKTFLGSYVPPEKLHWDVLTKPPIKSSFAWCATHAKTPVFTSVLSGHGTENFAHRLNKIYLAPFGALGDEHRFFCYDEKTRDTILKQNQTVLKKEDFNLAAPNRPYLIANTVLVANGFSPSKRFVPIEITPNYTGSPASRKLGLISDFPIGGGYVESFGYDSVLKSAQLNGRGLQTQVDLPKRFGLDYRSSPRFSLADAMAASGAAPSVPAPEVVTYAFGFPEFYHWSPTAASKLRSMKLIHTDGGAIDNSGIIPLLRRQVGTIVAFVNTEMQFHNGAPVFPDYIGALFGLKQADYASQHCKVFSPSEYPALSKAFMAEWNHNAPLIIHRQRPYTTVENKRYGIPGGLQVRMIWVFLGGPKTSQGVRKNSVSVYPPRKGSMPKWVCDLPEDTRTQVMKTNLKGFEDFPYYHTFLENGFSLINLSPSQVNALSQFTSYSVMENKDIFRAWKD